MTTAADRAVLVAVDGGGSKTDAAVVDAATGEILGRHRGPGCSQHSLGVTAAAAVVDAAVSAALLAAGIDGTEVQHAACYLTAIDLPDEAEAMHDALAVHVWASRSLLVDNDVFALLRAGTDSPDAAVVVCGTGINGAAVAADGRTARIVALGHISGDWGGAGGLAEEVLWHAARAEDGRGPATALSGALLSWTARGSVHDVTVAVHRGELRTSDWIDRMPEVLSLAAAGDAVARAVVQRQGEEIGVLAASLLERLGLGGAAVPVVLGGGIASSDDALLTAAVHAALAPRVPHAVLTVVAEPPLAGAVALARAAVAERV